MKLPLILLLLLMTPLFSDPFQDADPLSSDEVNMMIERSFHEKEMTFILIPIDSFNKSQVKFTGNYYLFDGENASKFSKYFRAKKRHGAKLPDGGTIMAVIAIAHGQNKHRFEYEPFLYFVDNKVFLICNRFNYQVAEDFERLFTQIESEK